MHKSCLQHFSTIRRKHGCGTMCYFCFGFIYSFITRLRNYIHYVSHSSDYNMTNTFRVKQQQNTRHEGNVGYIVLFIKVNNNNKNT